MRATSLPADEQATEAVVPRVRALDDPAPRLASYLTEQRLLAASPDVRADPAEANRWRHVRVVVALVEA